MKGEEGLLIQQVYAAQKNAHEPKLVGITASVPHPGTSVPCNSSSPSGCNGSKALRSGSPFRFVFDLLVDYLLVDVAGTGFGTDIAIAGEAGDPPALEPVCISETNAGG